MGLIYRRINKYQAGGAIYSNPDKYVMESSSTNYSMPLKRNIVGRSVYDREDIRREEELKAKAKKAKELEAKKLKWLKEEYARKLSKTATYDNPDEQVTAKSTAQTPDNIKYRKPSEEEKRYNIKEGKEEEKREVIERDKERTNKPTTVSPITKETERKNKLYEAVNNPGIGQLLFEAGKAPGRYLLKNPLSILGDAALGLTGSDLGLFNTLEDRIRDRKLNSNSLTWAESKKLLQEKKDERKEVYVGAGTEAAALGLGKLHKMWKAAKYAKSLKEVPTSLSNIAAIEAVKESTGSAVNQSLKEVVPESSINWGKWNKDIPNDKDLMSEYATIEETSKRNGTWMKNSDGSGFKGSSPTREDLISNGVDMTPEEALQAQFVEQQSKAFVEAKGSDFYTSFRGVGKVLENPSLDTRDGLGSAIFSGDRELARNYGNQSMHLAQKQSSNSFDYDGLFEPWTDLHLRGNTSRAEKLSAINTKKLNNLNSLEETVLRYSPLTGRPEKGYIMGNGTELTKEQLDRRIKRLKYTIDKTNKHLDWAKNSYPKQKGAVDDMAKKVEKVYELSGDNETITTNDVAEYIEDFGLDYAKLKNIHDGGYGDVTILNHKKGNYLKSLIGNNGKFDMNNPNIYKSLAAVTGIGGLIYKKK